MSLSNRDSTGEMLFEIGTINIFLYQVCPRAYTPFIFNKGLDPSFNVLSQVNYLPFRDIAFVSMDFTAESAEALAS